MTRPLAARRDVAPRIHDRPLPDWTQAECRDADPDLFNGPRLDIAAAREFCDRCPIRDQCRTQGRAERADGVWGGQLLQDGITPVELAAESAVRAILRCERRRAEHGTRSRYTAGCHCAPCYGADRAYHAAWRARRRNAS